MNNKGLSTVFTKSFTALAIVAGVILALAVMFVSAYVDKSNNDAELATNIEYVKRQYSNYIEFNNTEEAKSLMRKAESAKLIRDCNEKVTSKHLEQHAEELAATGITVLDKSCNVVAEYTEDGVGFKQFKNKLNTDNINRVMKYDHDVYMKRIQLDDESYVDVAIQKCPAGALLIYRHTIKEFAVKSILSIQNLLDGYDPEQNGTFVITDGSQIVASNDKSLLEGSISEEDYQLVYDLRQSGKADQMVTLKADGENMRYFGRYSHGREFYVCAFMSERQIYEKIVPIVVTAVAFYVVIIAIVQFIRMRTVSRLITEKEEQEYNYKHELEKKNVDLSQALDTAEAANLSKRSFLFNMSHDIRTPMNAIIGFTDLAEQNIDDKGKVGDYLGKIMKSSQHLLSLINDILDMSRIESGKANIEMVPVCIKDQMELVKDVVRSDVEAKGLTYVEKSVDVDDIYVYADALHVNRVLMNILANAVKFTPEGGTVTFTLRERPSEHEGHAYYDFIIEDTGIGMSEEFIEHIFEQFAREKTSTVSNTRGTGLGMSITKSLVDLMGGSIEVQSELGRGSVFTVTFEFKITTADMVSGSAVEQEAHASVAADLYGRRILLVEDNELNMEIAVAMLEALGIEVDTANDGSVALDKVNEQPADYYDLILMDIQMPMMNGHEATRAIRALDDKDKASLPIIAMTANAFEEDKESAYAAGMNAHVAKPVDAKALSRIIAEQIQQHEKRRYSE